MLYHRTLQLEAEHAARFRQQILDDPGIRVPAVVWELSARRVLCLDYVPGIKITDRPSLLEAGVDPAAVAGHLYSLRPPLSRMARGMLS
jgi:predicted unusual protein kinase regulating ubiquinone biosynthesis (AarF/ABC1/UbiB family)